VTSAFPDPLLHPIVFSTPRRLSQVTAWQEHIPFAMYLVDVLRPRTIVELGTHHGDSYCAFCQAVDELGLPTKAYAVDTWRGDPHSGVYSEEVLHDLRAHHDPLYGGFSELIRGTFEEARPLFHDGALDLVHIDGCHRYEAARSDFDSWLPTLSERGVVVLHDTTVRAADFGVWRLLEELRDRFPTFEFVHGNGLAIVLTGGDRAPGLVELTELEGAQLAGFRSLFATLGNRVRCIGEFRRSEAELGKVTRLEDRIKELEDEVRALSGSRLVQLGRALRPRPDRHAAR
jgi:hypothetical protein